MSQAASTEIAEPAAAPQDLVVYKEAETPQSYLSMELSNSINYAMVTGECSDRIDTLLQIMTRWKKTNKSDKKVTAEMERLFDVGIYTLMLIKEMPFESLSDDDSFAIRRLKIKIRNWAEDVACSLQGELADELLKALESERRVKKRKVEPKEKKSVSKKSSLAEDSLLVKKVVCRHSWSQKWACVTVQLQLNLVESVPATEVKKVMVGTCAISDSGKTTRVLWTEMGDIAPNSKITKEFRCKTTVDDPEKTCCHIVVFWNAPQRLPFIWRIDFKSKKISLNADNCLMSQLKSPQSYDAKNQVEHKKYCQLAEEAGLTCLEILKKMASLKSSQRNEGMNNFVEKNLEMMFKEHE